MAEEVEQLASSSEAWKEIRGLIKAALLAGKIPVEPCEMRPKEVYEKFVVGMTIDYTDKKTKEKLARMLRALRAKHKNGDLVNEDDSSTPIEWAKSAAKQVLRKCFRDGTIPTSFKEKEEIEQIWKVHCNGHEAFKRMKFDEAFVRRIKSVRDDHLKKVNRCEEDLEAYTVAKQNHPTPEFNARGEPQWNGSEAQRQLKAMVANGEHVGEQPKALWAANDEFRKYSLKSFRDHIYQEQRLQKFNYYVQMLKQEKVKSLQY